MVDPNKVGTADDNYRVKAYISRFLDFYFILNYTKIILFSMIYILLYYPDKKQKFIS